MLRSSLLALALALGVECTFDCTKDFTANFGDMHDGDKKSAAVAGSKLTITPYMNNETWTVEANWDSVHCNASVDFRVPGKPGPPPCPLTLQFYLGESGKDVDSALAAVFFDPSGTLPSGPLNAWIQI